MNDRMTLAAVVLTFVAALAAQASAQATRSDPTPLPSRGAASTAPAASKGPANDRATQVQRETGERRSEPSAAPTITGGVPAMGGVTPNRAELASSAFTKLDGANRGFLTLDDVRQLSGFESAFRQADQNGDGRLNASEFNSAWSAYTGNAR